VSPVRHAMSKRQGKHPSGRGAVAAYCARHRRYYRAHSECPICRYERAMERANESVPRIRKCPVCSEMSLFYYQCSSRCECLNVSCKLAQAEAEY
jgi:hypothetical protein